MRTFFALDLTKEYKERLAELMRALSAHLRGKVEDAAFRWVKPESLHLTLQFLGQVPEDDVAKLLQQVHEEVAGTKSFYLRLGPLEWFPSVYRPHVLSLKAEPAGALAKLSQALARGAAALSYKVEERPFRAHLTLARIEGLRSVDAELLASFPWPELPEVFVKELVFFRSDSERGGSVYTKLASFELERS